MKYRSQRKWTNKNVELIINVLLLLIARKDKKNNNSIPL